VAAIVEGDVTRTEALLAAEPALATATIEGRSLLHVATERLPHWDQFPPTQVLLDRAFQFACRSGELRIAMFLYEHGADVGAKSPANTTGLDEAAAKGHSDIVNWIATLGN